MKSTTLNETLRQIPSVDEVLTSRECRALAEILPHETLLDAVRHELSLARKAVLDSNGETEVPGNLSQRAAARALKLLQPSLKRVVNATGVVLHTNLGRSVLAEEAVRAVEEVARGYSTLEYDINAMQRGSRHAHCEQLICALTGAEAAIAVNNNAAAVLMVLAEFACGKEAVVSRGELVEIGGSFRIPDIMELSGARMVEVGTTNKTHAYDYERAIGDDTAMLLKVHTSNYRLIGFTESVEARQLRRIADAAEAQRNARTGDSDRILVYEDLGSGALLPPTWLEEGTEPTAGEALHGCDLVSFSGDKLLGGPQAGIVIGSKELIDRLKANPFARAMRLDKMTLAALEATLRLYLDPQQARESIPTLRMLQASAEELRPRAEKLAEAIRTTAAAFGVQADTVTETSRAGGGALPMCDIPTYAVRVSFQEGSAQSCEEYLVRRNEIPIIARIKQEALLFDVRTLVDDEEPGIIAKGIARYFQQKCSGTDGKGENR